VPYATLKAEVDKAAITKTVVGASKPESDQSGIYSPMFMCSSRLDSDSAVVYAHAWEWTGSHIEYVDHSVYAFQTLTGKAVVAQAKALATSCKTYAETENASTSNIVVNGAYAIPTPSGIDGFYAFCETSTFTSPAKYKGQKLTMCTAVMSRGQLFVTVFVYGHKSTISSAQSALKTALAPVAKALVAAVPAPIH
jgi:hypothetical protein